MLTHMYNTSASGNHRFENDTFLYPLVLPECVCYVSWHMGPAAQLFPAVICNMIHQTSQYTTHQHIRASASEREREGGLTDSSFDFHLISSVDKTPENVCAKL